MHDGFLAVRELAEALFVANEKMSARTEKPSQFNNVSDSNDAGEKNDSESYFPK